MVCFTIAFLATNSFSSDDNDPRLGTICTGPDVHSLATELATPCGARPKVWALGGETKVGNTETEDILQSFTYTDWE